MAEGAAAAAKAAEDPAARLPKYIPPKTGMVHSEAPPFKEALCKPKILPIRAPTFRDDEDEDDADADRANAPPAR